MLNVNEIFGPTIQGEGIYTGMKAVFVRLSGCNMWSGKLEDKAKSACPFCDTDFLDKTPMTESDIIKLIQSKSKPCLVVITGGEPLLQDVSLLCSRLIALGYVCQIETNGSIPWDYPELEDLVSFSVSPKAPRKALRIKKIDSLKVLFPHPNRKITPESFDDVKCVYKSLQPMDDLVDNQVTQSNIDKTIKKIFELGGDWRLGLQVHKTVGLE
jgi:organic radical activating enzyme